MATRKASSTASKKSEAVKGWKAYKVGKNKIKCVDTKSQPKGKTIKL